MPKEVERYKTITCHTCGKVIKRFDRAKYPERHVPAGEILRYTRRHYKQQHPVKWKEAIRRGVKARAKARK